MVTTLTKENFKEITSSSKPVVIDVFATWCGPCQMMKPFFEELAKELSTTYTFAQLNVDESRELAIQFGVSSVPTFVFMKNGAIIGKEVGYMSKEDLKAKITELLG
jgi:thioredoxin